MLTKIWDRTQKTETCWLWKGPVDKNGYGLFRVAGKTARVARLVYKRVNNVSLRESECVLHRCDNPGCINPAHLFVGTHAQNMADMAQKGRANRPIGALNGRARLTPEQSVEIRARSRAGESQFELASAYSVSRGAIYHVLAGRTWN